MTASPPWRTDGDFEEKYQASCFCGRVKFAVSADPVVAKICDDSEHMRLHAAPAQWVSLFHKDAVRFKPESLQFIRWYHMSTDTVYEDLASRQLPAKVQCKHCGTPIMDEGRDMIMAFPTLFEFVKRDAKPEFPPAFLPTCHIFCATKCLDTDDGLPNFLDDRQTPLSVGDFLLDIAPRLDGRGHKGQAGRICVLGGSIDYAGAPFYAGMSALRAGAELLYLCTALEATGPIKSYSPELMVSEVYRWSHISSEDGAVVEAEKARMVKKMVDLLPRLHAMAIGPGLGRDDRVLDAVKEVILRCREHELPLVIDADGLWLIQHSPEILQGYGNAVITPNVAEYGRLAAAVMGNSAASPQEVCDKMAGPILLQKGPVDRIFSPGKTTPLECAEPGAPRRPGGLGDFLAGSLSTFLGWSRLAGQDPARACQASCTVVRRACSAAYAKKKRAMVAPDVLEEVAAAFDELCPAPLPKL